MTTDSTLGKNLFEQRKLKGYSQEKLSDKSGVTVRTIQRIEKGEVNPHPETISLLAEGLSITTESLLASSPVHKEEDTLKWLLVLHGVPFLGICLPFLNNIIFIFLWVHKREAHPDYNTHGRAIVNFQITLTLLFTAALVALVTIEGTGFFIFISIIPLTLLIMITNIIFVIKRRPCYFPLSIPFIPFKPTENKSSFNLVLCTMIFIQFSAIGQQQNMITRLDGTRIEKSELTEKLKNLSNMAHVHGMSVAVFNQNKLTYNHQFGFKDATNGDLFTDTTNIYGASLSKAVFAVLVMKLVEEKVIDLDTPLESYLPKKIYEYSPQKKWHDDYSALKEDHHYQKITARMCLKHTTGFPNWRWFEADQKLKTLFEPGERYFYSGEGLVYLQVVIEKILHKSLEELAQEKLFRPLKMSKTSYQWQPSFERDFAFGHDKEGQTYEKDKDNDPRSASTLETTSADLATFFEAVLQKKIITPSSWKELMEVQIRIRSEYQFGQVFPKDTNLYDELQLGYGLGWGVLHSPHGPAIFKEGHGDGFQHYCILFPEAETGVMILTNSDNGESIFKAILEITIADVYTPWKWQNYLPYDAK